MGGGAGRRGALGWRASSSGSFKGSFKGALHQRRPSSILQLKLSYLDPPWGGGPRRAASAAAGPTPAAQDHKKIRTLTVAAAGPTPAAAAAN